MTKLSDKQERFCREYLRDLNATQAAIRAGYSKRSAEMQASRLLRNDKVKKFLETNSKKIADKLEISAERVLNELAKLAFYDARKMFDDDGNPIHISRLDDNAAASIVGVEVVTRGNDDHGYADIMKVKLADKKGALELLGKHLKLFTDKVEHTGKDGAPLEHTVAVVELKGEALKEELKRRGLPTDILEA